MQRRVQLQTLRVVVAFYVTYPQLKPVQIDICKVFETINILVTCAQHSNSCKKISHPRSNVNVRLHLVVEISTEPLIKSVVVISYVNIHLHIL